MTIRPATTADIGDILPSAPVWAKITCRWSRLDIWVLLKKALAAL